MNEDWSVPMVRLLVDEDDEGEVEVVRDSDGVVRPSLSVGWFED